LGDKKLIRLERSKQTMEDPKQHHKRLDEDDSCMYHEARAPFGRFRCCTDHEAEEEEEEGDQNTDLIALRPVRKGI
jgi:hypothetical protein